MIRTLIFFLVFVGINGSASAQYRRDIDKELSRLDAKVALMLSKNLDYMPIWSENSDSVYVYILDTWYAMEIVRTSLVKTEIKGHNAGWNQNELLEPISAKTVASFELDNYMSKAHGDTLGEIEVSIKQQGLSSAITINVDGKEHYRQQSDGEAYVFPSISPNGKYVVFISELNGLMLVRLPAKTEKVTKLDKKLNAGIEAMNRNNCEKSIKLFQEVLEIDSTNTTALHNLALCQFNLNLLDELDKTLQASLRHDPDYFESHELLASLYYLQGNYEKGSEICEKIMAAHPYYYENYYLLLATYEALEELDKICNTLEKALDAGIDDNELKRYHYHSCN